MRTSRSSLRRPSLPISASTRLLAVIGHPVGHSLSPVLHNWLFSRHGFDGVYVACDVLPERLQDVPGAVRALGMTGLNVTIPHKEAILPLLDKIDPLAREVGAVNTVVNRRGVLWGYNTDVTGFMDSLKGVVSRGPGALLGCGGVGRAAIVGMLRMGMKPLYVADADAERAARVARDFGPRVTAISPQELPRILPQCALFVNGTPVGMRTTDPAPVDLSRASPDLVVYEVVYHRITQLVRSARKRGLRVVNGIELFARQAANAFTLWTGVSPVVPDMVAFLHRRISR